MRLVAVTRVLNEDDIIEAFVRHHAPIVDHHLFLDNGSVDRTLEILTSLRIEGLPITVLQNTVPFYVQEFYNTQLFRTALSLFAADWVMFVDADEFLDERDQPGGLRARLAALPRDIQVLKIPTIEYVETPGDCRGELLIPARMRWRVRQAPEAIPHVTIRAIADAPDLRVRSGAHNVVRGTTELASLDEPVVRLAHFPRRNAWQMVTKTIIGRLKLIAAGAEAQAAGLSTHYAALYETLRDRPEELLADQGFLHPGQAERDVVEDPIEYLGAALRYTRASDPIAKMIRSLIGYAEVLASGFGGLADGNSAVALEKSRDAGRWVRVI
jgi:hypothetical protein